MAERARKLEADLSKTWIGNRQQPAELRHSSRTFSLMDQSEAGFHEHLGQDQAIRFRAGPREQFQVLADLGEPGKVQTWGNVVGNAPQPADGAVNRR
jgi:hypothetical protein